MVLCQELQLLQEVGVAKSLKRRFEEYGEVIGASLAHADRQLPAQWYLRGLMLSGGGKSVEPMACTHAAAERAFSASIDVSPGCQC